jgi:signal transduction histidine kinase
LDLAQTARAAAELYEPVAEEKGCALTLDVEPGIMIRGDRHLLSQAVANLLDNALKYGGGEVRLSAHQADGRAALEVSDSGPGIPEGEREAVFDRFVRLEPSRSTPGNGLGLSLVRAVARLHNGTVALGEVFPGAGQPGLKVRLEFAAL